MHISLDKQDTCTTYVYLAVRPVNTIPWFAFPLEDLYGTWRLDAFPVRRHHKCFEFCADKNFSKNIGFNYKCYGNSQILKYIATDCWNRDTFYMFPFIFVLPTRNVLTSTPSKFIAPKAIVLLIRITFRASNWCRSLNGVITRYVPSVNFIRYI